MVSKKEKNTIVDNKNCANRENGFVSTNPLTDKNTAYNVMFNKTATQLLIRKPNT